MKTRIEINPPNKFPCIALDSRDGSIVGIKKVDDKMIAVVLHSGDNGRSLFSSYEIVGKWPYEYFPGKLVLSNEWETK